jgi:hypothetical protein
LGLGSRCGAGSGCAGCCEDAGTVQHISAASDAAARRKAKFMKNPWY